MSKESIDELITLLKENFPKNAIEINECLMLLNESLDSASKDIRKKIDSLYDDHKYDEALSLISYAKQFYDLQTFIGNYSNMLELDDTNIEKDTINEEEQEQKIEEKKIPNYSDYLVDTNVAYTLYEDFTHKCPAAFSIQGQKTDATQWKDVLLLTCEYLARNDSDIFQKFVDDPKMQGKKINYFSKTISNMRKPVKIDTMNIFVETNMSSNQIRNVIIKMLKQYGISLTEYKVYLRADYTALHKDN